MIIDGQNNHVEKTREINVEVSVVNQTKANLDLSRKGVVDGKEPIIPPYDQLLESAHEKRIGKEIKLKESEVENRSSSPHSVVPLFVSISSVDDLLEEHDRQIQEATERMMLEKKKRRIKD